MDLSEKLSSQIKKLKKEWNKELIRILKSYGEGAGDEKKLELESTRQFQPKLPYKFAIISGPSGVGRSTIGKILNKNNVPGIRHYTTRPPRSDEEKKSGIYVYVSKEEFSKMQSNGDFLQDAETYGDWRGITKEEVLSLIQTGQKFYIDKSVWTTKKLLNKREIKQNHHIRIFILPPSFDELVRRLIGRTEQDLKKKIKNSGKESQLLPPQEEKKILDRLEKSVSALKEGRGMYQVYLVNDELDKVADRVLNYL